MRARVRTPITSRRGAVSRAVAPGTDGRCFYSSFEQMFCQLLIQTKHLSKMSFCIFEQTSVTLEVLEKVHALPESVESSKKKLISHEEDDVFRQVSVA